MSESRPRRPARLAIGPLAWATAWLSLASTGIAADPPDPTRPPDAGAPVDARETELGARAFALQSVLISEGRRVAIVNGRRLREGDDVDGATVLAIEDDRVRLATTDGVVEISLVSLGVKRGAPIVVTEAWMGPEAPLPAAPAGDAESNGDAGSDGHAREPAPGDPSDDTQKGTTR